MQVGQKDINNKIVENGKLKIILEIFVTAFSDFLMKFLDISKKCSNLVNFRARKMFFFFKQVQILPEKDRIKPFPFQYLSLSLQKAFEKIIFMKKPNL